MSFNKDRFNLLQRAFYRVAKPVLSDAAYANLCLRRWLGGGDVNYPKTFNEKVQWLKIHDRNRRYVQLADKYSVRAFVEKKIGKGFLNDLLGFYQTPAEIDWAALPDRFVFKVTHGSGMNILVNDKSALDQPKTVAQLRRWLKTDYSRKGREWVYRDSPRKIIAERFLSDATGQIPQDYKVFCFNGEPQYIQVDLDRFGHHRRVFFDADWHRQPFTILHETYDGDVPQPLHLPAMMEAARILAQDIPFVRVDFYALPKLVFGEMTFYPGNGTGSFEPPDWDLRLGDRLKLPGTLGE